MSNNNKPAVWHFDDFPFMGGVSAEAGNMIVCGRLGAGKTALMIQAASNATWLITPDQMKGR